MGQLMIFCLLSFLSNNVLTREKKYLDFSRVRTQIVGVEGEYAHH